MAPTMEVQAQKMQAVDSSTLQKGLATIPMEQRKVDCSKVYVTQSTFGPFDGAFAAVDIKEGEVVERGLARRLPLNGHDCTYVFTWSEDRTVWATCSGCATFYNSTTNPNVKMNRYFDEDRFEIIALRDIKAGEEMMHTYRSLKWRQCFVEDTTLQNA